MENGVIKPQVRRDRGGRRVTDFAPGSALHSAYGPPEVQCRKQSCCPKSSPPSMSQDVVP